MNKWQTMTDMEVTQGMDPPLTEQTLRACLDCRTESIRLLEPFCSEFLIHAADNEGLQSGIDEELVIKLGEWCTKPVTYAGGARHREDLELVKKLSGGKVDLTIGSALDVFGGDSVKFDDCVEWTQQQSDRL